MSVVQYDIVAKQNGKDFADVLKNNGCLDICGVDKIVRFAGNTAVDAERLIVLLNNMKDGQNQTSADLFNTLNNVGYHYVVCDDSQEKHSFITDFFADGNKPYWLCCENGFNVYHIVNAVKSGAKSLRPGDAGYADSVLSICNQGAEIVIKNRCNDTINGDGFVPGLAQLLRVFFGQTNTVLWPKGYTMIDKQIIKYNYKFRKPGCYDGYEYCFGSDFYADADKVYPLNPHSQVMLDYFVLDLENNIILNPANDLDCFPQNFMTEIKNKNVRVLEDKNVKRIVVDGCDVVRTYKGKIIYVNMQSKTVGLNFLSRCNAVETVEMPLLETAGVGFFMHGLNIKSLKLNKCKRIGGLSLVDNIKLSPCESDLSNLECAGPGFLNANKKVISVVAPKLKQKSR